jgi:hypothetical protein
MEIQKERDAFLTILGTFYNHLSEFPKPSHAGRLVPYDYYVHNVRLEETEQAEWDRAADRIRREYARLPKDRGGERVHSNSFKLLLFRRAAILKQAAGKIEIARQILERNFQDGDRWLIYCDSQDQVGAGHGRFCARVELQLWNTIPRWPEIVLRPMDHFLSRGGVYGRH